MKQYKAAAASSEDEIGFGVLAETFERYA